MGFRSLFTKGVALSQAGQTNKHSRKASSSARKAMTSDKAMRGALQGKGPLQGVTEGITKLKRSDLPKKRNLKSIYYLYI